MATIRRRNGKYQVQGCVQGCAPLSKTYTRLEDAKTWARLTEVEAEQIGLAADPGTAGTDPDDLMKPFPAGLMKMWPIGRKVGLPRNDTPDILDEIDPDAEPRMV